MPTCGLVKEDHEEQANKELAFILLPENPGLLLGTQRCQHPLQRVPCHGTEEFCGTRIRG